MNDRKHVLVVSFTDLSGDSRVRRQIRMLQSRYRVTAVATGDPNMEGVSFVPIPRTVMAWPRRLSIWGNMFLRRCESLFWSNPAMEALYGRLCDVPCDVMVVNNVEGLPLAFRLREQNGAKVLLDAHEYAPKMHEHRITDRLVRNPFWRCFCHRHLSGVDAMVTVCQGLAEMYEKEFGVSCGVVTNAPFYQPLEPSRVEAGRIRMIHHGGAMHSRRMEDMIFLTDQLDERFSLDFMITPYEPRYYDRLRRMASRRPRIRFRDTVPSDEIAQTINEYDVGLYPLRPSSFNHAMALPNKIFEFIQGRLAVAIWPSPEMSRLVRQYDCGVVSEQFTVPSLAAALNGLSGEEIRTFKANSHRAAKDLCAETNRDILLGVAKELIGD